jgi:hypothetical protein
MGALFGGAVGLMSISLKEPVKNAVSDSSAPRYHGGFTLQGCARVCQSPQHWDV